jgi:hypothetical protein
MDINRRAEIRKAIMKKQTAKLVDISKDELIEYIEETEEIVLTLAHNLVSSI